MPTYPDHIIILNNNFYIKIFRFIGAISMFLSMFLSKIEYKINFILYQILLVISVLYLIYRLVLVFYAMKQSFHYLISGKFIVKNSCLWQINHTLTFLKLFGQSAKNTGSYIFGTGLAFSLGYELDEILSSNGYQPYFIPGIKTTLRKAGLDKTVLDIADYIGIKKIESGVNTPSALEKFKNLSLEEKLELEKKFGVKQESVLEALDYINNKNVNKALISKEIADLVEKNDPFGTKK